MEHLIGKKPKLWVWLEHRTIPNNTPSSHTVLVYLQSFTSHRLKSPNCKHAFSNRHRSNRYATIHPSTNAYEQTNTETIIQVFSATRSSRSCPRTSRHGRLFMLSHAARSRTSLTMSYTTTSTCSHQLRTWPRTWPTFRASMSSSPPTLLRTRRTKLQRSTETCSRTSLMLWSSQVCYVVKDLNKT